MTIIQKIQNFLKKKFNLLYLLDTKSLKIRGFNPFFLLTFFLGFSALFFISSNLINKKNETNSTNFEEITKTNEFSNLKNYFISKIRSPYEEVNYIIKNNDTVEKILKNFNVRNEDIKYKKNRE